MAFQKICADCGSTAISQEVTVWVDVNDPARMNDFCSSVRTGKDFCFDCKSESGEYIAGNMNYAETLREAQAEAKLNPGEPVHVFQSVHGSVHGSYIARRDSLPTLLGRQTMPQTINYVTTVTRTCDHPDCQRQYFNTGSKVCLEYAKRNTPTHGE